MRLIYLEHALKTNDIKKSILLANCFVNINVLKCEYNNELIKSVNDNCPNIFKNELRIPQFYMNNIINIKKKLKIN